MSGSQVEEGVLLGLGNPLLDLTVYDEQLLKKYDLLPNNAIIAEKKHLNLFEDMVKNHKPIYLAGGATQNSIRVAQWLLQKPKATSFFGGVGNDIFQNILREKTEEVGVNVHYEVHDGKATGKCGAIITGEDRSLVTDLGAAELFTAKFMREQESWDLVEKAKYFYIGGFIVPVSAEAVVLVAKHAADSDKTVIMNLHATFLCKYFANPSLNLMQYVDVLFGNSDEAREFSKEMGFGTDDLNEIARKTAGLPKLNNKRQRLVVFTQGRGPTVLCQSGEIMEVPVKPVEHDLIKDTNGCGDAFVGGFLSQMVQGKKVEDSVRCGAYAAKTVIQHYGCNYPDKPDFV